METQVPARENTILDKQIHGPRRRGGSGPTINQIITNMIGATVSGEVGYLTVFATENSLQSSSFLYEDATGVGLNTTTIDARFNIAEDEDRTALAVIRSGVDALVPVVAFAETDDGANATVLDLLNLGRGETISIKRDNGIAFIPVAQVYAENSSDFGIALEVRHDGTGVLQSWNLNGAEMGRWNNNGNLELLSGLQTPPPATITANHTIATGEHLYLEVSPPTGGCTITLPSASPAGQWVIIKDIAGVAGADVITINAAGSDTIDAGTSTSVATHYGCIWLLSNGSNWAVISIFNL